MIRLTEYKTMDLSHFREPSVPVVFISAEIIDSQEPEMLLEPDQKSRCVLQLPLFLILNWKADVGEELGVFQSSFYVFCYHLSFGFLNQVAFPRLQV